ncbi:MAG: cob(I)yrinic acid a,c-diamide adenosyltransferase [Leptonema sp. (in: bacteria)]
MRIYTKKGDKGETFLANGNKVYKYDIRVELYGLTDEFNSHLGMVIALIQEKHQNNLEKIIPQILWIQNLLFEIGSELAGYYKNQNQSILKENDVTTLENWIDEYSEILPKIRAFILPGGSLISTQIHICRTLCRKLERRLVQTYYENKEIKIFGILIQFFNRLSDYLFVLARYCNFISNIKEREWQSTRKY